MKMLVGVKRLVLICPQDEIQASVGISDSDVNSAAYDVEDDEIESVDEVIVRKVVVSVVLGAEEIKDCNSCVTGEKNMVARLTELQRYSK